MQSSPVLDKFVRPIFIIGAPRSGTSITTWVLGQHPNIQPMPETSWIAAMAAGSYTSYTYGASRGRLSHLSNVELAPAAFMRRVGEAIDAIVHDCYEERCQRLYGNFRERGRLGTPIEAERDGFLQIRRSVDDPKSRWIDGTPFNTFFIWALAQMFPEAQFIHNLRRPDEVATSLEGFDKFGHAPIHLQEGLVTWSNHTEAAWLGERALGEKKVFRLNFERIANDAEGLIQDVCGFLGEAYSTDCLLPLRQRINSSEVEDRRELNLEKIRLLPEYQASEALYKDVLKQPPSSRVDDEALDLLRSRFIDYCRNHPLI
jgi:hypothetical protein